MRKKSGLRPTMKQQRWTEVRKDYTITVHGVKDSGLKISFT